MQTNPNQQHPGLAFRGRPVDLIEMAAAVLMVFFLTYALGCAALTKTGLTEEDASRIAVLILPGFLTVVMAVRYLAAAFGAVVATILALNGLLLKERKDKR